MITTRSQFWESLIAGWISLYLQSLKSFFSNLRHRRPCLSVNVRGASVGRSWTPFVRAVVMALLARDSESAWQTIRVVPRFLLRAENRSRAFGTSPPAGGLTVVSGAGSG